ncbi:MAG: SDR family oxidoreductase [Bacteroidetes bacterium]|nr:SDR family oxidoreductase [Bacteroidota bacterium]
MNLQGKHILITGASAGIGRQTAIDASLQGAQLTITGRNEKELQHTLQQLSGKGHSLLVADLKKEAEIKHISNQIKPLDGIVHGAGIVKPVPVKFIQAAQIEDVFSINFISVVLLNAQLLQQKKINNGASVVLLSTISTLHPYFGGGIYIASKAALEGYGKTLALELLQKKIRVNILQPAMVKTAIYQSTIETAFNEEEMKKYENQYPLGIGNPNDVSEAICYLLSEKSKWITGTSIPMDGGLLLGSLKS